MNAIRALLPDQSGAAASELALMLPLMLLIMFGGFEAGHYFYNEHKIVKAAREGARYAGRLPFSAYDCSSGTTSRASEIQTVTRTGTAGGTVPRISNWSANNDVTVTVACTTGVGGIFSGKADGAPIVTVSAEAAYPSLFGSLGVMNGTAKVRASAQAVVNGL